MQNEDEYHAGNPALAESGLAFVLTGCSGGGKSTLLKALAGQGYAVQQEAGRQIVREQMHVGGDGLPWMNPLRFVELAASRTMHMFNVTRPNGQPIFFDRALVDLTSFLELKGVNVPADLVRAVSSYQYAPTVFVTPPWREIYIDDGERGKSFGAACSEYEALLAAYERAGYSLLEVPRVDVERRVSFIVEQVTERLD